MAQFSLLWGLPWWPSFHFFGDCLGGPVFHFFGDCFCGPVFTSLENALVANFHFFGDCFGGPFSLLWRLPWWPSFPLRDCLGSPVFTLETILVAQFSLWRLRWWPSFHFGDCLGGPVFTSFETALVAQFSLLWRLPL